MHMNLAVRHAYCRSRLGVGAKDRVSLDDLICEALAKDGMIKPDGVKSKVWVNENLSFVLAQGRIAKSARDKQKKERKLSNTEIAAQLKKPPRKGVTSSDFLQSFEWRRLRMEALKKYGTRCQCCGASPQTGAVLNVDHIKPRKFHPELALDINNLQVLCHECNHGKGNWDETDWRNQAVDNPFTIS